MSEPTSADLKAQIDAINAGEQVQPQIAQAETVTGQVQPVQAEVTKEPTITGQVLSDPNTKGQDDTKLVSETAVDPVKEAGFKSTEDLVKSYREAQKKISQLGSENSRLRSSESVESTQVKSSDSVSAQPSIETANQRFVDELSVNPISAIAKIVDAISENKLQPYRAAERETKLNNEIVRLSTSPETAMTFNVKIVQDEIKKVCEENPEYLENLPRKLEIVHDIALGRLARRGINVTQQKQTVVSTPVPDSQKIKSEPAKGIDISKATSAELKAYINSL